MAIEYCVCTVRKSLRKLLQGPAACLSAVTEFGRFLADAKGSTTVIMGLTAIPVVLAAGLAIDTTRISREQTKFSVAVDSAALAVAASTKSNLGGFSASAKAARMAELKIFAKKYVMSNYTPEFAGDSEIELDMEITDTTVTINAQHAFPTTIMAISGVTEINLKVFSEVTKSGSNVEVALILDNTNSMSGSRIVSLRTAAKSFVNTVVKDSQTPYYSKVALIPYTMGVNVGNSYAVAARGNITGGTSTTPGSTNYTFKNPSNNNKTFAISTCVSERTGLQAYTDAAVSTYKVGRNYPAPGNPCSAGVILPLSSNKTTLNSAIDAMVAGGSTAGHVGVAWGWYALSPTFGLWTGQSVPAAYGTEKLTKVAILMTDGEYNSPYCNGVIAANATNGSGSSSDHINCNATNGSSYTQAQTLCNAMKAKGIVIYTVAFDLVNTTAAQNLMTNCATDADHRYDAANETELQAVFQTIANDLLALRLSK